MRPLIVLTVNKLWLAANFEVHGYFVGMYVVDTIEAATLFTVIKNDPNEYSIE